MLNSRLFLQYKSDSGVVVRKGRYIELAAAASGGAVNHSSAAHCANHWAAQGQHTAQDAARAQSQQKQQLEWQQVALTLLLFSRVVGLRGCSRVVGLRGAAE